MSNYSNLTEQDLIILGKLAEEQKNQRALKIKNGILKQTHDLKLAESLSPITKKFNEIKETTRKPGRLFKKSDVEDRNSQTPAIENVTVTQSLRDTLSFMKKSKKLFKLEAKDNGSVYWNGVIIKPLGESRVNIEDEEYDINPKIRKYFTQG